jgi:poly-gamma-glutamate synthesis protein (capsule biosynthesis protein)
VLSLCGDVMTGRGVDQILPHPSEPELHEPFVDDAREYVRLAEQASGAVPRNVDPAYIWGDAIAVWERMAPAARIANLETSITRSGEHDRTKGIHYRMHPDNVGCLTAVRFDVCAVANNHVLDYGREGLLETLRTLEQAGVRSAGAGRTLREAQQNAACPLVGGGRVIVGACAHGSSGIHGGWAAATTEAGIDLLPDLSDRTAAAVVARVAGDKRRGDVAIVSIHWGDNWGYGVPERHVAFAHRLIDGGIDIVHGHSSHHVRPLEVYRQKLILYGCGDVIDDYEGISGYEAYRDDLVLIFFPSVDVATGRLVSLQMVPFRIRRLRLHRASLEEARWVRDTVNRISGAGGVQVVMESDGVLTLSPRRP